MKAFAQFYVLVMAAIGAAPLLINATIGVRHVDLVALMIAGGFMISVSFVPAFVVCLVLFIAFAPRD